MAVFGMDKYTLFSGDRIDVAALTAIRIGSSWKQARIPRGLTDLNGCFSHKVLRIDVRGL